MDARSQFPFHLLNGGFYVRVNSDFIDVFGLFGVGHFGADAFGLADAPGAFGGFVGDFALHIGGGEAEEAAAVSGAEFGVGDHLLEVLGQLEEADEVDDGGAVFAGAEADLFGAEIQLGGHAGEGGGGFDGVEVFALDILDQGNFEEAVFGDFADDDGDLFDSGEFGSAPAALACHQLVVSLELTDHQGLDDAVTADGLREFGEAFRLKDAAGLQGIDLDLVNGDEERGFAGWSGGGGFGMRVRHSHRGAGGQEGAHASTEGFARMFGFAHG